MPATLIVTGPQGCGKTRRAAEIAAHFGLSGLVDDWDGKSALPDGALVLTSVPADQLKAGKCRVMSFEDALAAVQAGLNSGLPQWDGVNRLSAWIDSAEVSPHGQQQAQAWLSALPERASPAPSETPSDEL